uniref:CEA cell adhesion molecule 19 n=1 Tax=Ailuropoda melanoleuca TaxID=9646 RepID=A0A7N5JXL6_AILME
METPERAQCHFSKASVLALWIPQGSWAALRIQKIPEHPQKDENLLLSVQGIPGAFQDFNWYLGEETNGGAMLFTYFPDLQRPQRDGSDMGQRDIVGFPNGSMLLHRVQPTDSGTYQVAVTINPDWTMRAKTEVRVAEKLKELPITQLPVSAGIMATILIGSLAAGSLFIGFIAHLLLTRGWRGQSHGYRVDGAQAEASDGADFCLGERGRGLFFPRNSLFVEDSFLVRSASSELCLLTWVLSCLQMCHFSALPNPREMEAATFSPPPAPLFLQLFYKSEIFPKTNSFSYSLCSLLTVAREYLDLVLVSL